MYTRDGVFDVHFFFLQTVYIFKCISLVKRYSLSFSLFFSSAPPAAILPLLYIVLFHCITPRARSPPRHAFTGQKCVCALASDKNGVRVVGGPRMPLSADWSRTMRTRMGNIRRTTGHSYLDRKKIHTYV